MAEISEKELEDILKDLPAHKIYSELNENFQSEPKFDGYCKRMRKFKKNDNEMKNLCKRIAYNLEKLSGILRNDANDELSKSYCSYEYYEDYKFSQWKKMKNLHDYFKNFDQIKEKINSAGDKYKKDSKYIKYIKYISEIYDEHESECCGYEYDKDELCPTYFNCDDDLHPEKLLSLLESNKATSGAQPLVKGPKELNTQGEISDNIALEIQNRSDLSGPIKLNELKKDEFQTTDQSSVITGGKDSQYSALPSIQNPVDNSCQYVDNLEDNSRNMNCRSKETSKPSNRKYLQEKIDHVSGSLQAATEQIKD
ncbi:PIR protein, partial [Plasmodium vivax]